MIRIILLGTAFLGVSAGLVLYLAGGDEPQVNQDVTRDATELTALAASMPASQPVVAAATGVSASLGALVDASQAQTVNPDAAALTQDVLASVSQRPEPAANRQNPADALAVLVREAQGAQALEGGSDNDAIAALTRSVLANLDKGHKPDALGRLSIEQLVSQAVREGQSDAYLDAMLNEAHKAGDLNIPDELITSDNRVDTSTLLSSLVKRSIATTGVPEEFKSVQKAVTALPEPNKLEATQAYRVQPGDSLAAIAHRYYGHTYLYLAIYEANRDKLATPDQIKVGQTLTIPVL